MEELLAKMAGGFVILIGIILFISMGVYIYKHRNKLLGIAIMFTILLYASGWIIVIVDSGNTEKVTVSEIRDNKIVIDYTDDNHGDKLEQVINMPPIIKIKPGDTITVKYNADKTKGYYVLDSNVGVYMFIAVGILVALAMFVPNMILIGQVLIAIIRDNMARKKKRKKKKK